MMLRSVLLSMVMLGVVIVYWVDGHRSIAITMFDCWETRLGM